MRLKGMLVAVGLFAIVLAGCSTCRVPGAKMTENGTIMFSATGTSVVARPDDALSLVEAQVAAATIAKANLLEKIKGGLVASGVTVGDLMFEKQEAQVRVDGFLARADVAFMEAEPSRLSTPLTVTAVASLELTKEQLEMLADYVE